MKKITLIFLFFIMILASCQKQNEEESVLNKVPVINHPIIEDVIKEDIEEDIPVIDNNDSLKTVKQDAFNNLLEYKNNKYIELNLNRNVDIETLYQNSIKQINELNDEFLINNLVLDTYNEFDKLFDDIIINKTKNEAIVSLIDYLKEINKTYNTAEINQAFSKGKNLIYEANDKLAVELSLIEAKGLINEIVDKYVLSEKLVELSESLKTQATNLLGPAVDDGSVENAVSIALNNMNNAKTLQELNTIYNNELVNVKQAVNSILITSQLAFEKVEEGYYVIGRGEELGSEITVPSIYCGLPVTGIQDNAFSNDLLLEKINLPDSVTYIGYEAFLNTSLETITISEYVLDINPTAFNECSKLYEIVNMSSVSVSAGYQMYPIIHNLGESKLSQIGDFKYVETDQIYLVKYLGNDSVVTLPNGINNSDYVLNSKAFEEKDVKKVIFTGGCTTILENAFFNCVNLEFIDITGVNEVKNYAVNNTEGLYGVYLDILIINNLVTLYDRSFPTTNTIINNSTTNLDFLVFSYESKKLSDATFIIDNNFEYIKSDKLYLYKYSGVETSVTLDLYNNESYELMKNCFKDTIENLTFNSGVLKINEGQFQNFTQLREVIFNCNVELSNDAFKGCTSLENVVLNSELTYLPRKIFSNCIKLTNINIPQTVTNIDYRAFAGSGLTNVILPDNLTNLGQEAFNDCSLTYNVYNSGNYIGTTLNPYLVLMNMDKTVTEFNFHSDCKFIYSYAFEWCKLTSINIPSNILDIGYSAFKNSISLSTIDIYAKNISGWAFSYCSNITVINFHNTITKICDYAFYKTNTIMTINYDSTTSDFDSITKETSWNSGLTNNKVICTNGFINI